MLKLLKQGEFIDPKTRFLLLFIGDQKEAVQWQDEIENELRYCRANPKPKSTLVAASKADVVAIARAAEYASTTWRDLMVFNETYRAGLDGVTQQVELKLLAGFDESLKVKKFMQAEAGVRLRQPADKVA